MKKEFRQLEIGEIFNLSSDGQRRNTYKKLNNNFSDNACTIKHYNEFLIGKTTTFSREYLVHVKTKNPLLENRVSQIELIWDMFKSCCDESTTASLVLYSDGSGYVLDDDGKPDPNISFTSLMAGAEAMKGRKL